MHSRRRFLASSTVALSALGLGLTAGPSRLLAAGVGAAAAPGPLLKRPIPSSGELLPWLVQLAPPPRAVL